MGNVLGRVVQGMGNRKFFCSVLLVCLLTCSPTENVVMHAIFVCLLGCVYLYLSGEYFTVTTSLLVKGTSINRFLLFFLYKLLLYLRMFVSIGLFLEIKKCTI